MNKKLEIRDWRRIANKKEWKISYEAMGLLGTQAYIRAWTNSQKIDPNHESES